MVNKQLRFDYAELRQRNDSSKAKSKASVLQLGSLEPFPLQHLTKRRYSLSNKMKCIFGINE